jgi:hypothetical protein
LGVPGRELARLHPLDLAVSLRGTLLPQTLGDPLDMLGADGQFRQTSERLGGFVKRTLVGPGVFDLGHQGRTVPFGSQGQTLVKQGKKSSDTGTTDSRTAILHLPPASLKLRGSNAACSDDSYRTGPPQIGQAASTLAPPVGSNAMCSAIRQRVNSSPTSQARSSRWANVTSPFCPPAPNIRSNA